MIGCHELNRLAAQVSHAVEAAPTQEHLQETRVVGGRGNQPSAARFKFGRALDVDQLHTGTRLRVLGKSFRQPRLQRHRHMKRGINHS
jgi:hypothetical protein